MCLNVLQAVVKFEQRVPAAADSVAAHCGEEKVTVKVKQNFLGNDQLFSVCRRQFNMF